MNRSRISLRSAALAAVATTCLTAALVQPAAATTQADQWRGHRPPVISFTVTTKGGFTMPTSIHAGLVTFRIGSPEDGHAIQGFFLKNGAPYMHPRRVFFLEEMPLTPAKKTERTVLKQMAAERRG